MKRRPRRFVLILLLLAFVDVATIGSAVGGASTAVVGGAAEDVRLLVRTIESQHPSPFHGISREALHAAGESLAARADTLHRDQLVVELMRLIALLGERDGHSGIYPGDEHTPPLHLYPVKLYDFSDGLVVVGENGAPGLLGSRIVAIDGRPIAEIVAQVQPLIARDNEWQRRLMLPEFVVTAEVLHGLGVTPGADGATFTFESASGRRDVRLAPIPAARYLSLFGYPGRLQPVGLTRTPLWIRNAGKSQGVTLLQRGRFVYVTYNSTGPAEALAARIVRLARKRVFRRLIVDVRLNGGGDNTTYFALVNVLRHRAVNRYRPPAVLIGRMTFSAASNFVTDVERRTRARFFGEPTGGAPNQWGDSAPFRLPNVGVKYYLPRYYVQRSTPDDPRVTTEPHVRVDLSSADWFAGRDPVLDAALNDTRRSERATAAASPGVWRKVLPGGTTRCARGGRYAYWLRRGDPRKLLVFFQGGGGCFDRRSCAVGSTWFDDSVDDNDSPEWQGGVLDLERPANPFRGWSALYIPSCTGDVHVGTRLVDYGNVRVHQKGWLNARAALARAYREFPRPTVVFVAGCSAGSVGSAFHFDSIARRYPHARLAQLGDSLAFVFPRAIQLNDWGTHTVFPPFFRIGTRRWTMAEFVEQLARAHPRRTIARFNHASDDVQERFYAALGDRPSGFEPRLRAAESRLKRLRNYRSFLACGGGHCALPSEEFYSLRVGGVRLRDWVARLAAGKNVSCPTCR